MFDVSIRPVPPHQVREALAVYPELTLLLLHARGITNKEDAERFLSLDYERDTHDPSLLKDMKKAVSRIAAAIESGEHIVIYSDYDMDGIPGAVVLGDFFKYIGYKQYDHYIPHRNREGFGLNNNALDALRERGVTLVITVDLGISNIHEIDYAQELGIDVIVTDHHLPGDSLPNAYAIINPKQEGCMYPEKMLCGAGVAFKVVQALVRNELFAQKFPPGWEKWLLDMVGMATIADMVPLVGENRTLAHFGLIVLRKSRRPGLRALLRIARVNQRFLTEDDVGFMIAPRINAASRMGEAMDALKLLATSDDHEAGVLATHLNVINDQRKGIVGSIAKEIKKRLAMLDGPKDVIVMGNPLWKPSLLGLAANALVSEYARPVFLWGREEGEVIKGSCRSDGLVNVVEVMNHAREVFIEFGGHAGSGGFSVKDDMIHTLEDALLSAYQKATRNSVSAKKPIDSILALRDISPETYRHIVRFAPFGESNPKPMFLFRDLTIKEVRMFGKTKEHLELRLVDRDGVTKSAISFFMTPEQFSKEPKEREAVDLIATMEQSTFQGRTQLRLRIVDVV